VRPARDRDEARRALRLRALRAQPGPRAHDGVRAEAAPLPEALSGVSGRANEFFYDDVLLVDAQGAFMGFILVHALVRLQTQLLLGNIVALERSRQEISEKNRAMEEDLLMAREVQLAMLPAPAAPGRGVRWRFCSHYAPAGGVSGDFFQLLQVSDASAGILVCDVMGHGVRSALVTAMVRAFAEDLRPDATDPGRLLTRLNRSLTAVLRQSGTLLFVTAAYAFLDAAASTLVYGQAGHPTGFLRGAAGDVEPLPARGVVAGPALGLIEDHEYVAGRRAIAPGDAAILFTDGVFEVRNKAGEEWGLERLQAEIARRRGRAAAELLPALVAEAARHAGGAPFDDDVCLVSLETL
jgi:serine phosphatase RsbU (regulator of sigma subunit)